MQLNSPNIPFNSPQHRDNSNEPDSSIPSLDCGCYEANVGIFNDNPSISISSLCKVHSPSAYGMDLSPILHIIRRMIIFLMKPVSIDVGMAYGEWRWHWDG